MNGWFRRWSAIGDDGLTDAERVEYATRWANGVGAIPTAEQVAAIRVKAQRKPFEPYIPPACAKYLTRQEREFVDELIRLLTQ